MAVLYAQATRIVWGCDRFEQKNAVALPKGVSINHLSALLSPTQPYCPVRINSKHLL